MDEEQTAPGPEERAAYARWMAAQRKPRLGRCAYCGKETMLYGRGRFCSATCRVKANVRKRRGEAGNEPPAPPTVEPAP